MVRIKAPPLHGSFYQAARKIRAAKVINRVFRGALVRRRFRNLHPHVFGSTRPVNSQRLGAYLRFGPGSYRRAYQKVYRRRRAGNVIASFYKQRLRNKAAVKIQRFFRRPPPVLKKPIFENAEAKRAYYQLFSKGGYPFSLKETYTHAPGVTQRTKNLFFSNLRRGVSYAPIAESIKQKQAEFKNLLNVQNAAARARYRARWRKILSEYNVSAILAARRSQIRRELSKRRQFLRSGNVLQRMHGKLGHVKFLRFSKLGQRLRSIRDRKNAERERVRDRRNAWQSEALDFANQVQFNRTWNGQNARRWLGVPNRMAQWRWAQRSDPTRYTYNPIRDPLISSCLGHGLKK